jgi:MFS family permease
LTAAAKRSFAALSVFNYRLYFGGQVASLAGNWMQIVAELWLILELTDSGAAVGIATALQFSGILLFGAFGGALADRFDKRRLLIVTQTAMAAPALALFGFSLAGAADVGVVYALIAVRGLVLAVDNPARQAFVIEMVGPERVVNAVSLNSIIVHSARIAGPAMAGALIALWGVTPCFAFNALTFVAMIAALALMRSDELRRPERPVGDGYGIGDAFRHVIRTPQLRTPLLLMAALGTLGFNFPVIMPLLARYSFGGEVSAYTLLMIAMGVGAIVGSLLTGSRRELGMTATIAGAGAFGAASLLAAAAPTLALILPALALLGAASVLFAASVNTALQLAAEPQMRGRVMALYSIVFLGSTPIGGPIVGWLAGALGPRSGLLLGAAAALLAAVAARAAFARSAQRDAVTPPAAAAAGAASAQGCDRDIDPACEAAAAARTPRTARRRSEHHPGPRSPEPRHRGAATPGR